MRRNSAFSRTASLNLDRAVRHLRGQGADILDDLLAHGAPLGWQHIDLTGDYVWTAVNLAAPVSVATRRSWPGRLTVNFEQIA
jgi:Tn3 transposase DDE domain